MKINIKCLNPRRTFQVAVDPGFTLAELKAAIEKQESIPAKSAKLVFSGKPLREGVTLHDTGIQKDATLHLIAKLKTHVEVHVRVMNGRTFDLDCEPRASVAETIRNIFELLELDERPRVLCANQLCLDPASDLSQRGPIKDKDVLHLVLVPEPNLPSLYAHLGTQGDADRARAYGLAGSLYARCGGIFGVASFVDRCMDAWMADPTLNANDAVATWHQRAQRCGFKFLVTQLMGYLCGGPQVYTGRGMAASHKHLGIREEEWASFMEGLQEVCDELGLPKQEVDDVRAVIASMQADCVVADGEAVPPNPGHPAPAGDSLYARLGGAYPVALFCDRLVDALLSDRTVKIPLDAKRNEASLKYLFTELVCSIAGGPETMTAPSLAETALSLSCADVVKLLGCVASAADHLDDKKHAVELAQLLHAHMGLMLAKPIDWSAAVAHGQEKLPVKDHAGMRDKVDSIARDLKVPLLYVPHGMSAFLLAMDDGAAAEPKAKRLKMTGALGFEEAAGGIAMLPQGSDKDILFLIDKSGSMSGQRMSGAISNARKIYDQYTTEEDQVGMIAFNHTVEPVFELKPRSDVKRRPFKGMSSNASDDKRDGNDIWCSSGGGTAFYDALIKVNNEVQPKSSFSYLVALTDGADQHSHKSIEEAKQAIAASPWKLLVIGLGVGGDVRTKCEDLANSSEGGMYIHAADAGSALDEAFAAVAAQFVMPTVKSADAAAAGGGARGM